MGGKALHMQSRSARRAVVALVTVVIASSLVLLNGATRASAAPNPTGASGRGSTKHGDTTGWTKPASEPTLTPAGRKALHDAAASSPSGARTFQGTNPPNP